METGQKISQTTKLLNDNTNKSLSIQISLSGLSFCILNSKSNTIELLENQNFEKKHTPFEILQKLKLTLDDNHLFNQKFEHILIIYDNELSTIVPKPFFDENHIADYLKFNSKILKNDFVTYDTIEINNSVNVYVPFVNINNYIFERFGSFEYKHLSTILISAVLGQTSPSNTPLVHIHVSKNNFYMVVSKANKLLLYNTFEYETKEDFIYYILFVFEQLKLDPEKVMIQFVGQINNDDERYSITYKYVKYVRIMEPNYNYNFVKEPNFKQNHYILLNSF